MGFGKVKFRGRMAFGGDGVTKAFVRAWLTDGDLVGVSNAGYDGFSASNMSRGFDDAAFVAFLVAVSRAECFRDQGR